MSPDHAAPPTPFTAVLLGPPGSGKGTQAAMLAEQYKVPSISTGDLLRANVSEGSELGRQAETYMQAGELVPDRLILDMVRERLAEPDCANGYLLDGFPRTVTQAEHLPGIGAVIRAVLFFELDDDTILKRLAGRWTHPASGRVYHEQNHPPRQPGIDDETGEPLIQRPDDSRETISRRLQVYHQQTKPLIAYYQRQADDGRLIWVHIDASGETASVRERLQSTLQEHAFIPSDND